MSKVKNLKLAVKAVESANVHELSPTGEFVVQHGQARRTVGKVFNNATQHWDIIEAGVLVHYHSEYIKHLKEKSLLPVTLETAIAAGITWTELKPTNNKV
jgi:hypothetical protein